MLKKNSFKNVDIEKKLFKVFLKIIWILLLVNKKIENVNTSSCVLYILKIKGYDNTLSLGKFENRLFFLDTNLSYCKNRHHTYMYSLVLNDKTKIWIFPWHICMGWSLIYKL